ncbi:hypothetical protein H5410_024032 [Solanum commersonii]|uniref:Peptidase A1 domain-containing protein n=1 Tax=Solanum commersonii TaxID=4109 RepID=A0A9J5ZKU0_SOLCO|nr:hypothetical protein H5410_024032 [Solanum commersonii]
MTQFQLIQDMILDRRKWKTQIKIEGKSSPVKIRNKHTMALAIATFLFITLLSTTKTLAFDSCPSNEQLSVIPIYGKCSPFNTPKPTSWENTVINMASKDPQRLSYLSSLVAQKPNSAPIASGQQVFNIGNYVVRAKIGTPGQLMFMVLDTSSDTAWVPCSGCTGCTSTVFTPNISSTYGSMDCSVPECTQVKGQSCPAAGAPGACFFNQSYGGASSFYATLSRDSLRLGTDGLHVTTLTIHVTLLWCILILFAEFQILLFSGSLKLGPLGQPKNIRTTPLLKNPHRPSLYYVNLTGISVGRILVPIAPELLAFDPNTGAGTIIDSGTVITRFVEPIYNAIRDEFRNQVKGPFTSLGAFDTCFASTNEAVAPVIILHFTGMDLVLPTENSLIHSSASPLACLAMAAAPANVNSVLNVIANLQQQNLRILFDTANSRLGIARELCN